MKLSEVIMRLLVFTVMNINNTNINIYTIYQNCYFNN